MIKRDLLKLIACPACRSELIPFQESLVCANKNCRRQYPLKNNIPVLITDMSELLEPDIHLQRTGQ